MNKGFTLFEYVIILAMIVMAFGTVVFVMEKRSKGEPIFLNSDQEAAYYAKETAEQLKIQNDLKRRELEILEKKTVK